MSLCETCIFAPQYCRMRRVPLVTNTELRSRIFHFNARKTLASLKIGDSKRDFLFDRFSESSCAVVVTKAGQPVLFELDEIDFKGTERWLDDVCQLPASYKAVRIGWPYRHRYRTLYTLLRLLFPAEALYWHLEPANDNHARAHNDN